MPSPSEQFLDLAMKSLDDDAEIQVYARMEIESRIDPAAANDSSWDRAAASLAVHDGRTITRHWRWLLLLLAIIAPLVCMAPTLPSLSLGLSAFHTFSFFGWNPFSETMEEFRHRQGQHLPPEQRLILSGKSSDLVARCPDNPVYYASHGIARHAAGLSLPSDFLETAKRIDPDNGWFPAFAAADIAQGAVKSVERTKEERDAKVPRSWMILDQTRLDAAADLIIQASRLPRFESYKLDRLAEQAQLFPHANDYATYIEWICFKADHPTDAIALRELANVVCAKASSLADAGDRQGFQALTHAWEILTRRKLEESHDLLDVLITAIWNQGTTSAFHLAAERLELIDDSDRFKNAEALQEAYIATLKGVDDQQSGIIDHGNELDAMEIPPISRQALRMPPVTFADLTPGRLMEKAFYTRASLLVIYGTVAVAAIFAALRGVGANRVSRPIAARLTHCFRPADWMWIFGACVFPLLSREGLDRLTPLVGRDWSNDYDLSELRSHQFAAWLLLFLIIPALVAKWRLRKCLPRLDLGTTPVWLDRAVLILTLVTLPLSGLPYLGDPNRNDDYAGQAAIILLLVWLTISLSIALFSRSRGELRRQTLARLLVPAYLFILVLLALMSPVYLIDEEHWTRLQDAARLGTESNGLNRYEDEVVRARKAQILNLLPAPGR